MIINFHQNDGCAIYYCISIFVGFEIDFLLKVTIISLVKWDLPNTKEGDFLVKQPNSI